MPARQVRVSGSRYDAVRDGCIVVMAVIASPRVSPAVRPTLVASAMVVVLAGLATAFVYGALPAAVAGPSGRTPAPVVVEQHAGSPIAPPACAEITEDSADPACTGAGTALDTDTGADLNADPAPAGRP
ncbi:hypothetical protein ACWDUL_17165 [Nocardia niigatensis]|uniref:hypothetical protein n=1 Tax=Nocardia niigatensis TaxID=209249 RepID=UPI00030F1DBA|nr:hypothetical protein [Nocardia niigatensis]